VNEGLTRWSLLDATSEPGAAPSAIATGHGIAEYLHQLGPDGPIVPVT
jgi:hypothetical protein